MNLIKITIITLFGYWFIGSLTANSVKEIESFYIQVDYILFLIICIELLWRIKKVYFSYLSFILAGVFIVTFAANINLDIRIFLIHIKFVIYALIVSLNNQKKSYLQVWKYYWILIPVLILYVLGWNKISRPLIFYENNFELLALIIIFSPGIIHKLTNWKFVLFVLGCIVIRSGSLSVLLSYLILVATVSNFRTKLVLVVASIPIVLSVFFQKGVPDVSSLDRFIFAGIAYETWNSLSLIEKFLSFNIVEVAPRWNEYLNFYELSFNGVNYPVSLHSFHLRLVLVYGIAGYFLINTVLYLIMPDDRKVRRVVFLVLFISGLSISSYNNMFAFLGLYIITKYSDFKNKMVSYKNYEGLNKPYE